MKPRVDWWEILDLFCWGVETLARPSIGRALRGYDEDRYRKIDARFWHHLEEQQWVVRRGRGREARFTITAKGKQQCVPMDPRPSWEKKWDRLWRLVTFDVPESRRRDRLAFWRELRARKLGLLQRSVWIWPRPVDGILEEVVKATGVPECFAAFECSRVMLCTDEELVKTAWDFASIQSDHQRYLRRADELLRAIQTATDLVALARAAREERLAYEGAFESDPLLPRALWVEEYLGAKVWERHAKARQELPPRLAPLLREERSTNM